MLFSHHSTIATTSYQTTCTASERTFNKRQHANARLLSRVITPHTSTHYDMVAARTQPWRESRGCFTVPIAGEKGRWGQSSQGSKTSLRTTSSTRARKGPRTGPAGGALGSCGNIVLITYGEGGQDNCIQRTVIASTAEPSGTNWQPHGDKECFSGKERALPNIRRVSLKFTSLGSNCSFQGKQLLLARGSLAGKFKCLAVIWDNRKARQSIQVVSRHLFWQGNPRQWRGLCH